MKAAKNAGLSSVEKILVLSVRYFRVTEYVQARYYVDFLLSIFLLYLPSLMPHQTRWKIVTNTSLFFIRECIYLYLNSLLLISKFFLYIKMVLSLSEASSKVNLRYPQIITPLNSEKILDSL